MRFFIIPAIVGSLALGGCMTADNAIRQGLAEACPYLEEGHDTFVELAALFTIAQKYHDSIKAAYDPAHEICLHPETATTLKIVLTVGTAGVKIYRILTEITEANPAAMEAIQ